VWDVAVFDICALLADVPFVTPFPAPAPHAHAFVDFFLRPERMANY